MPLWKSRSSLDQTGTRRTVPIAPSNTSAPAPAIALPCSTLDESSARAIAHPASITTPTDEKNSVRSASSCPVGTRMFDAARYPSATHPSATIGRRSPRRAISAAAASIAPTVAMTITAITLAPRYGTTVVGP